MCRGRPVAPYDRRAAYATQLSPADKLPFLPPLGSRSSRRKAFWQHRARPPVPRSSESDTICGHLSDRAGCPLVLYCRIKFILFRDMGPSERLNHRT